MTGIPSVEALGKGNNVMVFFVYKLAVILCRVPAKLKGRVFLK